MIKIVLKTFFFGIAFAGCFLGGYYFSRHEDASRFEALLQQAQDEVKVQAATAQQAAMTWIEEERVPEAPTLANAAPEPVAAAVPQPEESAEATTPTLDEALRNSLSALQTLRSAD
ncbi:MAG: hypothetical protein AAGF10_01825 [Verrucomicrobiota bacterium]